MRPTWIEVPTKDVEVSKKFYAKVLGWTFDVRPNGMTMIADSKGNFGHFWALKGKLPARPQVSLYLEVDSVGPILTKAKKAGGRIIQEKTKLPDAMGAVGEFADPVGIVWGLHSSK